MISSIKPCVGCKYLVGFNTFCKADEQLTLVVDPLTNTRYWRDLRFPEQGSFRLSPAEMRKEGGRCGPKRKLYKPKWLARILPWLYD